MKKLFYLFFCGAIVAILASCATVMRENTQTVPIKANLEKVDIKILDRYGQTIFEGQTPTTVNLKTAAGGYFDPQKYTVIASKDGYKTQTTVIDWHVSGWYYAGNLLIGGLIGYLIIDPLTGDMYYLDEELNVNLYPEK